MADLGMEHNSILFRTLEDSIGNVRKAVDDQHDCCLIDHRVRTLRFPRQRERHSSAE